MENLYVNHNKNKKNPHHVFFIQQFKLRKKKYSLKTI